MKKINIKNEKHTLRELERLRLKKYFYNEIKIENVHLRLLNRITGSNLFMKDSIYVAPSTLWACMKTGGKDQSHNFHGMSPKNVYDAISKIKNVVAVYRSKKYINRVIIVTPAFYKKNHILVVVEIGARLVGNIDANINKIVTIYPKDKVSELNNEPIYKK